MMGDYNFQFFTGWSSLPLGFGTCKWFSNISYRKYWIW